MKFLIETSKYQLIGIVNTYYLVRFFSQYPAINLSAKRSIHFR